MTVGSFPTVSSLYFADSKAETTSNSVSYTHLIPANRAADYFKQAYEASKIVDEGGYALYKGDWATNNKDAQYNNFVNIFLKDTEENIFVKYFDYPDCVHSYDCFAPVSYTHLITPLAARTP